MNYRIATPADYEACRQCVASTGAYPPVRFEDIAGLLILAEDEDGVAGVIWAAVSGTLAIQNYLAVGPKHRHTGLGLRLILKLGAAAKTLGVNEVRFYTAVDNIESLRLTRMIGASETGPYYMGKIPIGD